MCIRKVKQTVIFRMYERKEGQDAGKAERKLMKLLGLFLYTESILDYKR